MTIDLHPIEAMIRRAVPADATHLAEFGARAFSETFGAENTAEDMALHLARTYGPALQSAEIDDPNMTTIIAESGGKSSASRSCAPGHHLSRSSVPRRSSCSDLRRPRLAWSRPGFHPDGCG